jgi:hypothetical protein
MVGELMARKSASLSKAETAALLEKVRAKSKQVNPQRLGFVGRLEKGGRQSLPEMFKTRNVAL